MTTMIGIDLNHLNKWHENAEGRYDGAKIKSRAARLKRQLFFIGRTHADGGTEAIDRASGIADVTVDPAGS